MQLPFHIAYEKQVIFLFFDGEGLIPITPHPVSGSCKQPTSALEFTPTSHTSIILSYDLVEL
jgi:hypothetical protein